MKPTYLAFFLLLVGRLTAQDAAMPARVVLYDAPNFQGECVVIDSGMALRNLSSIAGNWDDRVASVKLDGGATVTLYPDPRFRGTSLVLHESVPNLRRVGPLNLFRSVSSLLVVIPGPQRRDPVPEYHAFIDSICFELLGRPADAGMLAFFTMKCRENGWSAADLRADLCARAEFRLRTLGSR